MNVKKNIHEANCNLQSRLNLIEEKWKVPNSVKKDMFNFLEDLGLGKVNRGKRASERTRVKYITLLKVSLEFFNKPISKITEKDIEKFDKKLSSGKMVNQKQKDYSYNSKVEIKRALKVFLKWKIGEKKTLDIAGWLDTREKNKTPDYLKESEIEKLYKNCKNNEERYIIAVLFDTGARAEEFFNIRYEDVELPEQEGYFPKITLKEEYSKTQGRTISLYWKYSLEAVRDFVKEREKEGIKSDETLINKTYDGLRVFLSRFGKKILNKKLHFHLFRHSSATYYASRLNRQQLCYRYGWKFSSDMPDVYISRAGMNNKELDEKMANTELEDLKTELEKEKQQRKIKEDEFEAFKEQIMDKLQDMNKSAERIEKKAKNQ